ncbi:MAG: tRNA (N(6)-L-threonylcarbamoyladenosine(37)-C(2))-methylthiotransferase [archaeon]
MKKIFIKTYGCSLNQADSEVMAGLLAESKRYKIIDNANDADIVIINSCTVKNKSEIHFLSDIRKIKKPKVLAGCVPQAERDKKRFSCYSIIGTNDIGKIVEACDDTLCGKIVNFRENETALRLNVAKIRKNEIIEIIPVSEGCLGACTYCKTKQARGNLYSYQPNQIVKHACNAVKKGAKELWLTSQDMGCYGKDINLSLPVLLEKISEIDGDFFIRVGMSNPNHVSEILKELINAYKHPKLFKFLHIPLQSGNNDILKAMGRGYSVSDFSKIISEFRKNIPQVTIATDIICGYPGESDAQFNDSVALVKNIRPDVLNISRFWPRPDTHAASLPQHHGRVTNARSRVLHREFREIALIKNKEWIGTTCEILIDEHGKNGISIGRNNSYKQVLVKGKYLLGKKLDVKVIGATTYDLRAKVI